KRGNGGRWQNLLRPLRSGSRFHPAARSRGAAIPISRRECAVMHPELRKLNRSLKTKGESVILRRRVGTSNVFISVPCRAVVRGYQPEQLVGSITQQDSEAILSPTDIIAV